MIPFFITLVIDESTGGEAFFWQEAGDSGAASGQCGRKRGKNNGFSHSDSVDKGANYSEAAGIIGNDQWS